MTRLNPDIGVPDGPGSKGGFSPYLSIGYLSSKDEKAEAGIISGVRKGLAEQGLIEGQNVSIAYRWSAGEYGRLPELAADLVARKVDVIVASGLPAALAAKAASSTIAIVFRLAIDPIAFGLAQSLDRPGGKLTGVTMLFDPLTPKKLELLHELISDLPIGLLVNPNNPNAISHKEHAETAANALGLPRGVEAVVNLTPGRIVGHLVTNEHAHIGRVGWPHSRGKPEEQDTDQKQ